MPYNLLCVKLERRAPRIFAIVHHALRTLVGFEDLPRFIGTQLGFGATI